MAIANSIPELDDNFGRGDALTSVMGWVASGLPGNHGTRLLSKISLKSLLMAHTLADVERATPKERALLLAAIKRKVQQMSHPQKIEVAFALPLDNEHVAYVPPPFGERRGGRLVQPDAEMSQWNAARAWALFRRGNLAGAQAFSDSAWANRTRWQDSLYRGSATWVAARKLVEQAHLGDVEAGLEDSPWTSSPQPGVSREHARERSLDVGHYICDAGLRAVQQEQRAGRGQIDRLWEVAAVAAASEAFDIAHDSGSAPEVSSMASSRAAEVVHVARLRHGSPEEFLQSTEARRQLRDAYQSRTAPDDLWARYRSEVLRMLPEQSEAPTQVVNRVDLQTLRAMEAVAPAPGRHARNARKAEMPVSFTVAAMNAETNSFSVGVLRAG